MTYVVMNKKKIVIIGLGGIGQRHIQCVQESAGATLVAGVDPDISRQEVFRKEQGLPVFASVEELLRFDVPDGVIIATPPSARISILREVLPMGCHVLMEKPLAHTREHAQDIVELARQFPQAPVHVGFCHRFTGAAEVAKAQLEKGKIGDVVWMNINFSGNNPQMESRWMTDPALSGGGAAMDNACHAVDLFRFVIGESIQTKSFLRRSWVSRGDDSFLLAVQEESGVLGALQGSYLCSTPRLCWEICGSEATLRFNYAGEGNRIEVIRADGMEESLVVSFARERFSRQFDAWLQSFEGKPSQLASLEDAFFVAEIMHGVYA